MLNVVVTGTGPLFTLEEAKAHLRVEHGDDDALIGTYSDAAVAQVLQFCNLALVPEGNAAAAFKIAALMALEDIYAGRAPVLTDGSAIRTMIDPYRWLRV